MATDPSTVPLGEPSLAELGGDSWRARLKRGFLATRPKFFTASVLPVILGTGWGFRESGELDGFVFVLALVTTVCVHAASNVWNDVGDAIFGTDTINAARIHPYTGGSRFIQNQVLAQQDMVALSRGLALAAVLLGAILILLKGQVVLWLGLAGLALGYLYSSPAVRLSGRGVGEAAVGIAFGMLPVCGAAWLQSGSFGWAAAVLAIPVSCWVACILLINEVPDIAADEATGKHTLAVRLRIAGASTLYLGLQLTALAAVIVLVVAGELASPVLIVSAGLAAAAWVASRKIAAGLRSSLKSGIEITLAIHAIGCLWLAGWVWFD